jgi:hypothetical protein
LVIKDIEKYRRITVAETPGKSELLAQIERERVFWEQLVVEVGEEHMLEPGATGDWTFKDVVAHLNGWRSKTLARLDAARSGQTPAPAPWPAHFNEEDDVEEINAWIYQVNRDRPLGEVLDAYQRSFSAMREAVSALSERDLTSRDAMTGWRASRWPLCSRPRSNISTRSTSQRCVTGSTSARTAMPEGRLSIIPLTCCVMCLG